MGESWKLREQPDALQSRWLDEGLWIDEPLGHLLERLLTSTDAEAFRVRSSARPYAGTVGDVHELARRVASGLIRHGVQPGDAVAFQLPNWMEAAAVFWGASMAGAVLVPVVHFYGHKELDYILRSSSARILVTADRFGHQDFLANVGAIDPDVDHVFVVGEATGGHQPFGTLAESEPLTVPADTDASGPALVAFTSGTTSDPKGVVHTHRSVHAEVHQLSEMRGSGDHPMLVGAPVGHAIGMLSGLLLPLHRNHPVHLIDAWDPAAVLAAMAEDDLNGGSGATFFLQSLIDHPDCGPEHLGLLARVGLGGSPVPAAFADRVAERGVSIVRSFGCTEHPSITGSRHEAPAAVRMYTDGTPLPGVEIRLVDEDGEPVPTGTPGEILSRGPDLFAGYTDPGLTESAFTADGFFRTGDIGVLDAAGALTITDRLSDVIIRGGENISAAEIEEQLLRIPGVVEAAVVAAPDERLGEHACAFVRTADGGDAPELDDIRRAFEAAGIARQKWPEEIRARPDFPRTPSGKVKKYVLREELGRHT